MILSKLKEFYTSNRKTIFYSLIFWFLFYISQDVAFAACWNPGQPACPNTDAWADKNALVEIVDFIVTIASSLVALLSALVSLFLHPGWVNGTILWFDTYLKDIWIMVSNIVYFIFAFVLIAIAFMNIIWKWQDVWEMKQALPKFVIWVLMVPFSWFFVQFILSISAMLTVAVLSLPYETLNGSAAFDSVKEKKMCTYFMIDLTKGAKNDVGEKLKNSGNKDSNTCAFGQTKVSIDEILRWDWDWISSSVFWMINVYTYWIMKIDRLTTISSEDIGTSLKTLASVGLKGIFDLLFIVVYMILMIALFMALFARATWLWIHAMFSPVYWLLFFFGKAKEWVGEQKFGVWEFIKLALVPVYVSAALSFWMIFIFVAAHGLTENNGWSAIFQKMSINWWKTSVINKGKEINLKTEVPVIKMWSFTLWIKGAQWWFKNANDVFSSLWWSIWTLILELFGLAILWIAVMAALKSSQVTESVTEPIRAFGKSVWSLVAKSPQYAPIIPTPGGGVSMKWMQKIATFPQSALDQKVWKNVDKFQSPINSMFWVKTPSQEKLAKIWAKINDGILSSEVSWLNKDIKWQLDSFGSDNQDVRNIITKYINWLKKQNYAISDWLKDVKEEDYFKWGVMNTKIAQAIMAKDSATTLSTTNTWDAQQQARLWRKAHSWNKNNDTDKESPTTADTATAEQNTAINIKSISNIKLDNVNNWEITEGKENSIANQVKASIWDIDISKITKKEMSDKLDDKIYNDSDWLKKVINELEKLYWKKFKEKTTT